MKIVAIDMGTNSFLCLVADITGSQAVRMLKMAEDYSRVVRLGEKVAQNRFFLPEALERARACLNEFHKIIQRVKPEKIIATATSAARDAKNGDELKKICDNLNIPLFIIDGETEARLSFAGAVSGFIEHATKDILVVDVGGGSTELIYRPKASAKKTSPRAKSFDVGCVRLTEKFLLKDPVDPEELHSLELFAKKAFAEYGHIDPELVIAVAGTPTSLACVAQKIDFDEQKVEGFILSQKLIQDLKTVLAKIPLEQRKTIKGLDPMRADVIVAGAALLEAALGITKSKEIRVSTRGLRYGVALNYEEFK